MRTNPKARLSSWAQLRFSIIGGLLARPPKTGELCKRLEILASRSYQHSTKDTQVTFGASTIERWYYNALKSSDPLTRDCKWVREMMEHLCKKAGVNKFTFHALRHRISANLMDSGEATLGMIQEFLGHQRKTTTEDYLKTLERGAADVADVIDSMDEGTDKNSAQHEE